MHLGKDMIDGRLNNALSGAQNVTFEESSFWVNPRQTLSILGLWQQVWYQAVGTNSPISLFRLNHYRYHQRSSSWPLN